MLTDRRADTSGWTSYSATTPTKNKAEPTKESGRDVQVNIMLVKRIGLMAQKYFCYTIEKIVELINLLAVPLTYLFDRST